MINKRFSIFDEWEEEDIVDEIRDNGNTLTIGELLKLLNDLTEENEKLKEELQTIILLVKGIEDYTHDIKIICDVK